MADSQKNRSTLFTFELLGALLLVLFAAYLIFYSLSSDKKLAESVKNPKAGKNQPSASPEELATLENSDAHYSVRYPTNFSAIYTKDGVEFTPKDGPGKVILNVTGGIASVSAKPEEKDLSEAVQIIKDSFRFDQAEASPSPDNKGRFANIHFDPGKY